MTPSSRSAGPQARIGRLTLILVTLIGIGAFLAPFVAPGALASGDSSTARMQDSPLITAVLSVACLVVLFANLGPALSSKAVALLGVLVGINVVLRAFDLTFLPPGEFSPVFLLIALVGYGFGAQMGFLMGALTMLCSAFFTGGIGPWLPFQMFAAGWMGMSAAWLPGRGNALGTARGEVIRLAAFGFVWGFLYGAIVNLYFWPFLVDAGAMAGMGWTPGASPGEAVARYAVFYVVQSAGPDAVRALGNAALMIGLGWPLLRVFRRFRARFDYVVVEVVQQEA
jgi:energy-coupling factor transport system substrate-specific component